MNPQAVVLPSEAPSPPGCEWVPDPIELLVPPPTDLPYDDGEPLETPWHRSAMNLLIDSIACHFREREDFYVGGNMFLYYRQEQWGEEDNRPKFRGPDFFYVSGVERRRPRLFYAVWDEQGHYPNVIVELLSPTTEKIDRVDKRALYQDTFRTPEYFLCQPQVNTLEGLRLNEHQVYEPIKPDKRGWLWSDQLRLWVGPWKGTYLGETTTWLRFYNESGRLILREDERMEQRAEQEKQRADAAQQNAEQEKQRADAAQQNAEQEKQRADAAQQNAEQEKQRADAAETEMTRLRRELEEMRLRFPKSPE